MKMNMNLDIKILKKKKMSEIKCPKEVPGSPSYSVRRGESQRDISCRSAPAPSWRPRSFPPPAMWGLAGCPPHHSSPHGCFSAVLTLLRLYQIPNQIKSFNTAIVYKPKTYKHTFEIFDIGIFHTIHTSKPSLFKTYMTDWPTQEQSRSIHEMPNSIKVPRDSLPLPCWL